LSSISRRTCPSASSGEHRHLVDHHGELTLEVDALVGAEADDLAVRAEEVVGCTLVDEGDTRRLVRLVGVQRLRHQVEVGLEHRAVEPLGRARQRCECDGGVERELTLHPTALQFLGACGETVGDVVPALDRVDQRGRQVGGRHRSGEIARHHHQPAVAGGPREAGQLQLSAARARPGGRPRSPA
jgi:hypothetical protein